MGQQAAAQGGIHCTESESFSGNWCNKNFGFLRFLEKMPWNRRVAQQWTGCQ